MIPEELKYTKDHEWVRIEGDEAVVGITDHAQSELGDITFVELPDADIEVKKDESIATVESIKAASDIYSPLSGKIIELNASLEDAPELMNKSPYSEGWIYRLKLSDATEKENLLTDKAYEEFIKES